MLGEGRSDGEIITEFYRLALGREPDDDERAHWTGAIAAAGPGGRTAALEDFALGPARLGGVHAQPLTPMPTARELRSCDGATGSVGGRSSASAASRPWAWGWRTPCAWVPSRGVRDPGRRTAILIWLDGGPSHLETFDLKPDAPAEVRGPFRPIATNVPGLAIGEHFVRLARQMDKVCLVRSMTSELGEHNFGRHYLLTGYKPSPVLDYPGFGAVVAHCRGGPAGAAVLRRRAGRPAGGGAGLPAGGVRPVRRRGRPQQARLPRPRPGAVARAGGRGSTAGGGSWPTSTGSAAGRGRGVERRPRRPLRAGVPAHHARPRRRGPSTWRGSRPPCASGTGCTAWASPACWPAGWSRPAARSSP